MIKKNYSYCYANFEEQQQMRVKQKKKILLLNTKDQLKDKKKTQFNKSLTDCKVKAELLEKSISFETKEMFLMRNV